MYSFAETDSKYEGCCDKKDFLNEALYYHKNTGKSVFITTNGCSENRLDCGRMKQFFLKSEWRVTNSLKDADIILFNACGLTTIQENASINALREMNALKKNLQRSLSGDVSPK